MVADATWINQSGAMFQVANMDLYLTPELDDLDDAELYDHGHLTTPSYRPYDAQNLNSNSMV